MDMSNTIRVRVWDLPTRLFHWALAASVIAMLVTAYLPGHWTELHARIGYGVLALLLFRIVWGFVGGRWSRFASFLPTPGRWRQYLRQPRDAALVGHSPLGALSVYAMLLALSAQVATGLVSDDEIAFLGPLNRFVSSEFGLKATAWHKEIGQFLVLAMLALHLAAIAYYVLVARRTLVRPMISGDQLVAAPLPASRDDVLTRVMALVVAGLCGACAWLIATAS